MKTASREQRWHRIVRILVGLLLAGQSLLTLGVASFLLIFIPLLGGLAMVYGGSNATDEQINKTWWMIGLMVAIPFVVTILLAAASVLIIRDKAPMWVYGICTSFIVSYLFFAHVIMHGEWCRFSFTAVTPLLIPLAGMAFVGNYRKVRV